ncbi:MULTISPECIES: CaiB/BaiF CoA transferase family protein [Streptomyces]|uniref:CaiB/BaiF CoA transferase family protein n=1 Tax=Streptomyces TaxID=1883 RepID=UPI001CCB541F|nr:MULTISPECIES: CoA transferase [Streptomyces]MBZ6133470.1 CoA transferase [Streptomyces olivaceus]MCM8550085.1 CoA transferase [Streptomyces sp. STCH 565 A]MCU8590773.1 CoA transferase [Streptomyces sp. A13(2022)]
MSGPLSGVRVLDLSTVLAGPLASSLLGEFGAEVIKVEQPGTGDPARGYPPLADGVSAAWSVVGRNKSSVTVDLHHPDAAALVGRLAATTDVVVTNFRPATLKRFSIDFEDLVVHRPDLVMVHVSAFGRTGPYADRPGFARVAEAFAGLTHRTGFPDGPPVFSGYPVADGVTGIYAAFAATLALRQRDLTGEPQLADIGLYEPLLRMMEDFIADYGATGESQGRRGNENPHISPNNLYRTRDGRWLALPASTDQMWRRLVGAMGEPDLAAHDSMTSRIEHRAEIEGRVASFVAARDLASLTEVLDRAGVAHGPVNTAADICADPHVRARGSVVEVPDDGSGRTRPVQGSAGRFSGFEQTVGHTAPRLGEHTFAVLRDLGLAPAAIDELAARGVI